GETTAQAALTALGAGVRPNLLDNAYFVGGGTGYGTFPVNQKGRLSGNTDRQFICDRWNQFGRSEERRVGRERRRRRWSELQAEDGIRDRNVTGVQTCALPISGETTAQAALTALGAGVRPNLLDNAYFVGGGTGYGTFPVNQKGRLSGNTDRQFICDRWNQFG